MIKVGEGFPLEACLAEDTVNKHRQKTSRRCLRVSEASVDVTAAADPRSNLDQVTRGAL